MHSREVISTIMDVRSLINDKMLNIVLRDKAAIIDQLFKPESYFFAVPKETYNDLLALESLKCDPMFVEKFLEPAKNPRTKKKEPELDTPEKRMQYEKDLAVTYVDERIKDGTIKLNLDEEFADSKKANKQA